jgi:ureidoglycolate lyase
MPTSQETSESFRLEVQPISEATFEPFGHLSMLGQSASKGDHSAGLVNGRPGAKDLLYSVEAGSIALPYELVLLEKHSFSSQTFIPISGHEYLVVVALPDSDGVPNLATLRAFRVPGNVVVTYAPGIWHHPMASLSVPAIFAVLMWIDQSEDDETFLRLESPITLIDRAPAPARRSVAQ